MAAPDIESSDYNLLIYRAFGFGPAGVEPGIGAAHKKVLDLTSRRPYNWFCAVQQSPGGKGANRWTDPAAPKSAERPVDQSAATVQPTHVQRGNAMYNATEQIADLGKVNYANAVKLASLSIANTEKIVKLNLLTVKAALAQGVESAQAAASVKDVQELIALRTKFTEAGVAVATGYSRTLYELASEAQAEYTAIAEEAWSLYTKSIATIVDKASKSAPAGSETGFNAFKSTLAASTAAFDQFQKASKQVVSLADASVRAATASATKATKGKRAA
jgi:phasin family protein